MFSGSSRKRVEKKKKEKKKRKKNPKKKKHCSFNSSRINMAAARRFFKAAVLDSDRED